MSIFAKASISSTLIITAMAGGILPLLAQEARPDASKLRIERPTKILMLSGIVPITDTGPPPDMRKSIIESPVKSMLRQESPVSAEPGGIGYSGSTTWSLPKEPVSRTLPPATAASFLNPAVKPGEVNWRSNFQAACEAAVASGKPVLLFQLMGKLDRKFC